MFRLRVLGGFSLEGPSGVALRALPRRRAEAVLAMLAVSGDLGCTRDRLVALLWPESDELHSRQGLRDTLRTIRQALGFDAVLSTGNRLHLDSTVVSSDLLSFSQALAGGHDADAVQAYTGALLDGFHVDDAPEYERWLDGERTRLAREYGEALERLATAAEQAGAWGEAASWWAQAEEHDPLNSHLVLRHAEALAAIGDRANAIKLADAHVQRLHQELELEPDRDVLARIERIRRGDVPALQRPRPPGSPALSGDGSQTAAVEAAATPAGPEARRAVAATARAWWRPRPGRAVAALAVVAGATGALLLVLNSRSSLDSTAVVVAPFDNQVRDTSLAQLGVIATDWMVQALQNTGQIRVVPTAEVAATHWAPGAKVRDLALATGAGTVITGRATSQGDTIYLRADVVNGRTGTLLRSLPPVAAGRQQPLNAVKELGQRMAGALAPMLQPGVQDHWLQGPTSYEAYREYLEGEDALMAGQWEQAWLHYGRAFALDTTFLVARMAAVGAHANAGQMDWQKDSLWTYVDRRRDRLPRPLRLYVERANALGAGDYERALAIDRAQARIEASGRALFAWGYDALQANRPAEAVHVLVEAGNTPWFEHAVSLWWLLAAGYHVLGRHGDELRAARRASQLFPHSLMAVNAEVRALAAEGREDEVGPLLVQARAMAPDPTLSGEPWGGAGPWQPYEAALEFRAHGHAEAYRRAAELALDRLPTATPKDSAAVSWQWGRALALYAAQRWEEARAAYAALRAADSANVEFLGGLGVSEARLGHRAAATAIAARLTARDPGQWLGTNLYWSARIAALLGDRDAAVARLREALSRGMVCTFRLGFPSADCHRDTDFEALRGHPPFDELLRPRG